MQLELFYNCITNFFSEFHLVYVPRWIFVIIFIIIMHCFLIPAVRKEQLGTRDVAKIGGGVLYPVIEAT